MAASINDYFQKLGGAASLVNTPKVTVVRAAAGATLTVDNCNWDQTTGKRFATFQVSTSGAVVSGTEIIWKGIVTSSTSIGSLTRVAGAADTGNAIGDYVMLLPTSDWGNQLVTGLLIQHNQDGTHAAVTATSVTSTGVVQGSNLKLTSGDILDTNGNETIRTNATASAVNEVSVTNAATGNAPQISATGGDTNVDLRLVPKGTGNVKRGTTGGSIDWWEEIGRTTLSVAGDTITLSSLPARKYLKVMVLALDTGGTTGVQMTFNNDTASNYTLRYSINNAADTTGAATTAIVLSASTAAQTCYATMDVINISALDKLVIGQSIVRNTAGTGSNPDKIELSAKWANTSAQISRVDITNVGTGDFAIGSEVVVLGHN